MFKNREGWSVMSKTSRQQRAFWLGVISLLCPVLLGLLLFLMHHGAFAFRDDFHGYRGVGFFMMWVLVLLPAGAILGSAGIVLQRTSFAAILGLLVNLVLMLFFIFRF